MASSLNSLWSNPDPRITSGVSPTQKKLAYAPLGSAENPYTALNNPGTPAASNNVGTSLGRLQQYGGNTDITAPQGLTDLAALIQNLINDPNSGYRQALTGNPNWGQFNAGVESPLKSQFRNETIPGLEQAYSGGAYGNQFWSGARQSAERKAYGQLSDTLATKRYEEVNNAQNRMLQALQLTPQMLAPAEMQTKIAADNRTMEMEKWYKNQGLTSEQFQNDLKAAQQALAEDQNVWQREASQANTQLSAAQLASQRELGLAQLANARYSTDVGFNQFMIGQQNAQNAAQQENQQVQGLMQQGNTAGASGLSSLLQFNPQDNSQASQILRALMSGAQSMAGAGQGSAAYQAARQSLMGYLNYTQNQQQDNLRSRLTDW